MILTYSARSHVGRIRKQNEDSLLSGGVITPYLLMGSTFCLDGKETNPAAFAVCDGMGGESRGADASHLMVNHLVKYMEQLPQGSDQNPIVPLQDAIDEAHEKMVNSGLRMGTTMALLLVTKEGTVPYNVGDSRIYCLQKGQFSQLTRDHTWAEEQIRLKEKTPEEVKADPNRNKLIRCIGIGSKHQAEAYPMLHGTYRCLICSDGLTDMVSDSEISRILQESSTTKQAAERLVQQALYYGGADNVSVIVIDSEQPPSFFSRWRKPKKR
ncbi:MAG: protein phosphatase 2C domain-containing protein [Eubacteriales bacterium]